MEWGNFPKQADAYKEIENMIDFLLWRNLKPYMLHNYGSGILLERSKWKSLWPLNVLWKKDGY